MRLKNRQEMVDRDLTPEHTARGSGHNDFNTVDLHPEVAAAFDYVESVRDTSDYTPDLAWHGWALREAFLAGISYAEKKNEVSTKAVTE